MESALTAAVSPLPVRPSRLLLGCAMLGRELTTIAITIFGLLLVTFLIGRVIPIDPVLAVVGDRARPTSRWSARVELGLDRSLWQQFAIYVGKVFARRSRHVPS